MASSLEGDLIDLNMLNHETEVACQPISSTALDALIRVRPLTVALFL